MIPQPQKLQWSDKNPADVVDYSIDWIQVLRALDNDSIATANWSAPGLNIQQQQVLGTTTSAFISGGIDGQSYTVTCTITTNGGRTIRRQVLLPVKVF
jgi:hypothetical protein